MPRNKSDDKPSPVKADRVNPDEPDAKGMFASPGPGRRQCPACRKYFRGPSKKTCPGCGHAMVVRAATVGSTKGPVEKGFKVLELALDFADRHGGFEASLTLLEEVKSLARACDDLDNAIEAMRVGGSFANRAMGKVKSE